MPCALARLGAKSRGAKHRPISRILTRRCAQRKKPLPLSSSVLAECVRLSMGSEGSPLMRRHVAREGAAVGLLTAPTSAAPVPSTASSSQVISNLLLDDRARPPNPRFQPWTADIVSRRS